MDDAGRWAVYPSLKDRVVVVTGGASGIGESIVEAFARQDAQVVFFDIQDEAGDGLVQRLAETGLRRPVYCRCDLTDIDGLQKTVGEVLERFRRVDVLVNNAGNDTRHSMEEVSSASWDQTDCCESEALLFYDAGSGAVDAGGGRIDYQYGVDQLGDSRNGYACLQHGESRDCGDEPQLRASTGSRQYPRELRDAGSGIDGAAEAIVV
jgi:short chain dehydrogenase